jgi:transcriptional antiterminator NusG
MGKRVLLGPYKGISPDQKLDFGCLYCPFGKEKLIADFIERHNPQVHACAVCQTKRFSTSGVTRLQNVIMLHGYILFAVPENTDIYGIVEMCDEKVFVMTYSDGEWKMYGDDRRYAEWIFRYNGVIGVSKAYRIGDRISIVEGPLKDMEGYITRIDRRNRNGQVNIMFRDRCVKVWLAFEILEERCQCKKNVAAGDG